MFTSLAEDAFAMYSPIMGVTSGLGLPTAWVVRCKKSEVEAIELLTLPVERYEEEHSCVPKADPVSIGRFLIEQQHLTQRDLIPQFASESAVSMFMTGQRNLTLEQVRKLKNKCGN